MKTSPTQKLRTSEVVMGPKDKESLNSFIKWTLDLDTSTLVDYYCDYANRLTKAEGKLHGAKKLKALYNLALRRAAGLTYNPIPFTKSDKEGFPKVLKPFKAHLDGSHASKRGALTVLQLFKLINCAGPHSTSSITDPYSGSTEPDWLTTFDLVLEEEFPSSEQEERLSQLKSALHLSAKNGPNGPAIVTSPVDREAIRGTNLEGAIEQLIQLTGNAYLDEVWDETREIPCEPTHYKRSMSHSRIRVKHEPGGKSRLFCICDWFSQSALLPIHNFLMDWLKSQPQDGTANHSDAAIVLAKWTDGRFGTDLWSFDLTTATDRYPRFLEHRVISKVFGSEIADLWETVISDREFDFEGGKVRFAAGQPLGALSSWAAFAVTHHIHIRTAARLCGKTALYRMIGDDIAIARDRDIAQRYIGMMDDLSVPFSGDKSVLPEQMKGHPVAELAKRVFSNGFEITPVPPDAILEGVRTPMGLRNLIENCINRGYDRPRMIYPVQSSTPSQEWLHVISFPIRNRLPQLLEVKSIEPFWENQDESPPAGLSRGWFLWSDFSDEELDLTLRELLRAEVMRSYIKASQLVNRYYTWSLIGPDFDIEGGDWQPEPWDIHMTMVPRIVDYNLEKLEEALEDLATAPSFGDVYDYVGGLHSHLDLTDIFVRADYSDEKAKTRVFISKLISQFAEIARSANRFETLVRITKIEETLEL